MRTYINFITTKDLNAVWEPYWFAYMCDFMIHAMLS